MMGNAHAKTESRASEPLRRGLGALVRLLGLGLVTAAVYWQVGQFQFTNYDDEHYISQNPIVSRGLTPDGVGWALTTTYFSYWHPLTWLSHMLDCQVFGLDAGAHHYVSLLWHILNTVLLWVVLKRLTGSTERSLFVAACFALHPLHVESVAWLAERKDLVSTFFWLLSLGAYAGYARTSSHRSYGLALASCAAGLMAKPMVVSLPLTLLLLDFWPLRRWPAADSAPGNAGAGAGPRPLWALVWEKVPFFALAAGSAAITFLGVKASGSVLSLAQLPLGLRLANVPVSYVRYLAKMVWPTDLAVLYPMPSHWPWLWVTGATALVVVLTGLAVAWWRQAPYFVFGWLWYLITLLPTIGLVPVGYQSIADRYTYVPLIGLFVAVAWGAADLGRRVQWGPAGLRVGAVATALACGLVSRQQVQHWRNSITLWSQALRATRNNPIAHYNLGHALAQQGRTLEAAQHYQEAIRLKPDYLDAHLNLGGLRLAAGQPAEATNHFRAALQIRPDYDKAHNNLGSALLLLGDWAGATNHFAQAVRSNPNNANAHFNLGVALSWCGLVPDAVSHLATAARLMPADPQTFCLLGRALAAAGQTDAALASFKRALQLDPGHAQTMAWQGATLLRANRLAEGLEWLRRAVQADERLAEAHLFLALAMRAQGQTKAALDHWHQALRLSTDDPETLAIMAWTLATCPDAQFRDGPAALARAQRACTLTGRMQPRWLVVLAAAQAEVGDLQSAQATTQQAKTMAWSRGLTDLAGLCDRVLTRFTNSAAFHEPEPASVWAGP